MNKVFIEVKKVIDGDIQRNKKSKVEKEFITIDEIKSFRAYKLTDDQRTEFPEVKSMTLIYFKKPEGSARDFVPQARIAEEVSSFGKRVGSIEL